MAVNCTSLGFSDKHFCVPITLQVEADEYTINKGWIAGAFFLGLLIGAGLTALCVRPFLASWEKKKRQDEEELLIESTTTAEPVANGKVLKTIDAIPADPSKQSKRKTSSRFKRRKKVQDGDGEKGVKVEIDEALLRGMANVLSQTNGMSAEVEMADQDMAAIVAMERSQDQEKETIMLKVLEFLMRKKAAKRMVTENFCDNFIKKTEQDLKDLRHMIDREKEEEEEKLKNDPKLSKEPQQLETEMQILQTKYNHRQGKLQRDYREKIRLDLIRSSGMSEEEVEGVMEKLMAQMARVEEKLGQEQARQRRVLEERLAQRRQVMEYQEVVEAEQDAARDERVNMAKALFRERLDSGQLLERQNDELVGGYAQNLWQIGIDHKKDQQMQWSDLSEQLHQNRLMHTQKLLEKQAQERAMFLKRADAATSVEEIVKGYHDLVSGQHGEQEELSTQLDQQDVRELERLNKDIKTDKDKDSQAETERLMENLQAVTDVSQTEADKLLKAHKQRMAEYSARQQREKQAMLQRLQERLQQRLVMASESEARDAQQQAKLCEEQTQTIQKVLATNMDLTEEAKNKILKQHEQNMQALSNQLQRSKMRQQKSLEMKLNQRQARLVELKQKQEELKRSKKDMNEKEREKLEADLAAQIKAEEKKLEEARQAAVSELRRQLAAETEEALRVQDEEIGLLIARLQVGQARRKAILDRQDKTLKELQDQLEKRVVGAGGDMPGGWTENLLQQHYSQVQHLKQQMQHHRQAQERQLKEKIKAKQQQKEQEIQTQLEEEAQEEYTLRQQRGAGYASLALMQSYLEQRHQKAIAELERDMLAELEKNKDELNRQMELELQKELQGQRQSLLTQLAAVTNLPNKELEDAVDAAAAGKQSGKTAKMLTKDLRQGIERAKTSMEYAGYDNTELKRTKTDLDRSALGGSMGETPLRRPMSSKRPSSFKRQAFVAEEDEDDDGF